VARALTSAVTANKNKSSLTTAFVYLIELQLNDSQCVRVAANYDAQVAYQGVTWYPARVDVGPTKRSADGRIDDATLKISNVSRAFVNYLDGASILDRRVRLIILDISQASDATAGIEDTYLVQALEVTDLEISLRIGDANPLQLPVPAERFLRTICRYLHEYGDPARRCGYDSSTAGALASCDGTLEGSNGCRVHGDNEVSRGLPRLHPRRGGFFPGILEGPIEV
jgi:hypothetical protein